MGSSSDKKKESLLKKAIKIASKKVKAKDKQLLETFALSFCQHVFWEDLEAKGEDSVAAIFYNIFSFGKKRKAHTPQIRIYVPNEKEHGWTSNRTIIEMVNDDMPFLVDSVINELNRHYIKITNLIHPIVRVVRNKSGEATAVYPYDEEVHEGQLDSYFYLELGETFSPEKISIFKKALTDILRDVRHSVQDFRQIASKVEFIEGSVARSIKVSSPELVKQTSDFLRWLREDNFIFLGYREFVFKKDGKVEIISPLGIFRSGHRHIFGEGNDPATFLSDQKSKDILIVTKSRVNSTVHRPALMDVVRIKKFDGKGKVVGEEEIVGLFTSAAYNQTAMEMPLLREKVYYVLQASKFSPKGHDAKALVHILNTFPRDELFQIDEQSLLSASLEILYLQFRRKVSLFIRFAPFGHYASCLVYIPRDRFDSTLREKMESILEEELKGKVSSYKVWLGESDFAYARVYFTVTTEPGVLPDKSVADIEQRLIGASLLWRDCLHSALTASFGEVEGNVHFQHYKQAFPISYQDKFNEIAAMEDLMFIRRVLQTGQVDLNLYELPDRKNGNKEIGLKIYVSRTPFVLSELIPVLENMELEVISETAYPVHPLGIDDPVWVHDFKVLPSVREMTDLEELEDSVRECFRKVWNRDLKKDRFTALILYPEFYWRDVFVFQAISRYLRQLNIPFSQNYIARNVFNNPVLSSKILRLFYLRFDPDQFDLVKAESLAKEIEENLEALTSLVEERILHSIYNVVASIVRTNFFQKDEHGAEKSNLSFKIDCSKIDSMPLPRPMYEIYVYSTAVEGVHLRTGKVARGGLRWSDRREDFRTEILGLMKAQKVKNSVIVPEGAKGGFVVKNILPTWERDKIQVEGERCYKIFIRSLLDITDNYKGGKVVHPAGVIIHDAPDPYFVVAADKGTATFSDLANSVAAEYEFWLGDAFASGGSAGYDHKKMGITARGAWESTKRHFFEQGKDVSKDEFTAIGVGDMAGDVFGNGMLLSPCMKLVAAFNHLHIFIDPTPDPKKSFKERERLFKMPRSSWADYNPKLISKGGGVFERSAKRISLNSEIRKMLDIKAEKVTPNELIQAILKAPADLLWFGGIGTFIKGSSESDVDVGDRYNDAVRINGRDVQAKSIVEGANLGITQKGRIEYALHRKGRVNTDFIDNAGGVDCSDHEVNIKIMLNQLMGSKKLTLKARNELLKKMTKKVADLVLHNNYRQTQGLSLMEAIGEKVIDEHAHFLRYLETHDLINRDIEALPGGDEIAERMAANKGLVRPELAVLTSYSKIWLYEAIINTDIPDAKPLEHILIDYFPEELQKLDLKSILAHPLRREIITTMLVNAIVNRAGLSFVSESVIRTALPPQEIVKAYIIVSEILEIESTWKELEKLDRKIEVSVQLELMLYVRYFLERGVRWMLRNIKPPLDIVKLIEAFKPSLKALQENITHYIPRQIIEQSNSEIEKLIQKGVPEAVAKKVLLLDAFSVGIRAVNLVRGTKWNFKEGAQMFFYVLDQFKITDVRAAASSIPVGNTWEKNAVSGIVEDVFTFICIITQNILTFSKKGTYKERFEAWKEEHSEYLKQIYQMVDEIMAVENVDIPMLSVYARQMRLLSRQ